MRTKSPRKFWKIFEKENKNNVSECIDIDEFYCHFKTVPSEISIDEDEEIFNFVENKINCETNSTHSHLDDEFTIEEIHRAVKTLGRNKSCSYDNIIYEYFKEAISLLDKPLHIFFNHILENETFPSSWSKGVVIPVYKKGEYSDTNNYRGITLTSCFSKLFTVLINERLKCWANENSLLTDAQFGFKSNYSTVDAIFVLKSLIDRQLYAKKKLYCCYVDLLKCFDSIYRNGLWFKLIKSGFNGRLFKVVKYVYDYVKVCVKHMDSMSEFYSSTIGLFQGETLSPILFSLFVNDVESDLLNIAVLRFSHLLIIHKRSY